MNESFDESLLCISSNNGTVRVWKDVYLPHQQQLVSAFTALPIRTDSRLNTGALMNYSSFWTNLVCAGQSEYIRVFDMNVQQLVTQIVLPSGCHLSTSLAVSDHSQCVFVSCPDNSVRMFDLRVSNRKSDNGSSSVALYKSEIEQVFGCQLQRRGFENGQIVCCAVNRATQTSHLLRLDLRLNQHQQLGLQDAVIINRLPAFASSASSSTLSHSSSSASLTSSSVTSSSSSPVPYLDCFALHNYYNLTAVGSRSQIIRISDLFNGNVITEKTHVSSIRLSFAKPIESVTTLHFHPVKPILAVGEMSSRIQIMTQLNSTNSNSTVVDYSIEINRTGAAL